MSYIPTSAEAKRIQQLVDQAIDRASPPVVVEWAADMSRPVNDETRKAARQRLSKRATHDCKAILDRLQQIKKEQARLHAEVDLLLTVAAI